MSKGPGNFEGSAVGIIEEAIHLLRSAPVSLFLVYYLGSLPFILGFLYFWGDMSRNPFAPRYCSAASFGLALLFIFMKCMHSVFAIKVYERATRTNISAWSFPAIFRLVSIQTVIQASGFVVLPVAILATIPYPWAYAFYQNALVLDYRESLRMKDIFRITSARAAYNPRQNIFIMIFFSLFSLFVLLNLGIAVYSLPYFIKMLTGFESAVTMGGFNVLNSTFVVSIACLTYLCVDPLIKTVYVLRGFYGESVKTGSDLMAGLQGIPAAKKLMIVMFFIIFVGSLCPKISFADTRVTPAAESQVQNETGVLSQNLSQSIDDVMKRREFTWRMPEDKPVDTAQPGLLDSFFKWLKPYVTKSLKFIKKIFKAIGDFFDDLLPDAKHGPVAEKSDWGTSIQYLLFGLLMLIGFVLLCYALRLYLSKRKTRPMVPETITVEPDMADENIRADDLPPDRWFEMAMDLAEKGDFRLAIRALYLCTLAKLAEKSLITIAGYKSNREYQHELTRRAHAKKNLIEAFRETVGVVDRVWYGMYHTGRKELDLFAQKQKRIIAYAE